MEAAKVHGASAARASAAFPGPRVPNTAATVTIARATAATTSVVFIS
jgi:hypothetical protein